MGACFRLRTNLEGMQAASSMLMIAFSAVREKIRTVMSFSDEFAYTTCPYCNTKNVALVVAVRDHRQRTSTGEERDWSWLHCPRCGGAISIETRRANRVMLKMIPEQMPDRYGVEHLPEDVSQHFKSAQRILEIGEAPAAAVELRKTLEAAAQHQDVHERPLVSAIRKMAELGLITGKFTEALTHVRTVGNAGAHAGEQELTREEVERALKFTTQILRNLFEVPAELDAINAGLDSEHEEEQE